LVVALVVPIVVNPFLAGFMPLFQRPGSMVVKLTSPVLTADAEDAKAHQSFLSFLQVRVTTPTQVLSCNRTPWHDDVTFHELIYMVTKIHTREHKCTQCSRVMVCSEMYGGFNFVPTLTTCFLVVKANKASDRNKINSSWTFISAITKED
jgi:hypothetical protein